MELVLYGLMVFAGFCLGVGTTIAFFMIKNPYEGVFRKN